MRALYGLASRDEVMALVSMREGSGLRPRWCAVVGVKENLPLQRDAGDPELPVGDTAQGTAIQVATRPKGGIAAAARGVLQHSHARPVKHSVAQPDPSGADGDGAVKENGRFPCVCPA